MSKEINKIVCQIGSVRVHRNHAPLWRVRQMIEVSGILRQMIESEFILIDSAEEFVSRLANKYGMAVETVYISASGNIVRHGPE